VPSREENTPIRSTRSRHCKCYGYFTTRKILLTVYYKWIVEVGYMGIMAGLPEDNFAYEIFLELNK
jgi:hypothetical protein